MSSDTVTIPKVSDVAERSAKIGLALGILRSAQLIAREGSTARRHPITALLVGGLAGAGIGGALGASGVGIQKAFAKIRGKQVKTRRATPLDAVVYPAVGAVAHKIHPVFSAVGLVSNILTGGK